MESWTVHFSGVRVLLDVIEDLLNDPWLQTAHGAGDGAHHGPGLAAAGLTVGEDGAVVTLLHGLDKRLAGLHVDVFLCARRSVNVVEVVGERLVRSLWHCDLRSASTARKLGAQVVPWLRVLFLVHRSEPDSYLDSFWLRRHIADLVTY
jgi:hypothetical protein